LNSFDVHVANFCFVRKNSFVIFFLNREPSSIYQKYFLQTPGPGLAPERLKEKKQHWSSILFE